jgi:hypothetical protein
VCGQCLGHVAAMVMLRDLVGGVCHLLMRTLHCAHVCPSHCLLVAGMVGGRCMGLARVAVVGT